MKVIDAINQGGPTLSFEFFPPKTSEQETNLFGVIKKLKTFSPDFVSITYGAMGTTRTNTFTWAERIKKEFKIEPIAHLTLISFAEEKNIEEQLQSLNKIGIENILALRGDPPPNLPNYWKTSPWKNRYAGDLVKLIHSYAPDICLGVAGYPEKHPQATCLDEDILHLKQKIEAGAEYIISQLFFDNQHFFNFLAKCRANGINVPIIPGLMPITSLKQINKFTDTCGATLPSELLKKLDKFAQEPQAIAAIGQEQAIKQSQELLLAGVEGIHYFVMNQAEPISQILLALNFKKV